MLGARTTGKLAWRSGRTAGGTLRIAAWPARWPVAIEDWSAALNSGSVDSGGGGHGWRRNDRRRGVNRPRPGLRHDHAARGQSRRGRWRVRVALGARRGGRRGGRRGRGGSLGGDLLFRCSCGFGNRRSCNGCRSVNFFYSWRRRNWGRGSLDHCGNGRGRRALRRCNRSGWLRLGGNGCFDGSRSSFTSNRRFGNHDDRGRSSSGSRTRRGLRGCRSLGNHRPGRRTRGDGWWRRGHNYLWRGAGLRKDLARFRACLLRGRRRSNGYRRRWPSRGLLLRRGMSGYGPFRQMAVARLKLVLLLLGQYSLQHVAGLGNMREVDLGRNRLR